MRDAARVYSPRVRASRRVAYPVPMTAEELVISAARIGGALFVLRWAFAGSLLAILIDFSDLFMMNLLDMGGVRDYQSLDKWLDLAYMLTFLWVALRWSGPTRAVAVALFAFRIIGVLAFEALGERWVLLLFPNVFEFWFVFAAGARRFAPEYELTWRRSAVWLIPLTALKEAQEYALHGAQWLDNYRAVDVVIDGWRWVTRAES